MDMPNCRIHLESTYRGVRPLSLIQRYHPSRLYFSQTMPSRRSRSRSRSRDRSESPERRPADLPSGASPISESDYFQKSDEFRLWLKEEKGKVRVVFRQTPSCISVSTYESIISVFVMARAVVLRQSFWR